MTDLELTRLCAEAMGYKPIIRLSLEGGTYFRAFSSDGKTDLGVYNPLNDDAQAMALIKKFGLSLWGTDLSAGEWKWHAEPHFDEEPFTIGHGSDANRAICECVAKMQQAKGKK